jgi:hypothetical protein
VQEIVVCSAHKFCHNSIMFLCISNTHPTSSISNKHRKTRKDLGQTLLICKFHFHLLIQPTDVSPDEINKKSARVKKLLNNTSSTPINFNRMMQKSLVQMGERSERVLNFQFLNNRIDIKFQISSCHVKKIAVGLCYGFEILSTARAILLLLHAIAGKKRL